MEFKRRKVGESAPVADPVLPARRTKKEILAEAALESGLLALGLTEDSCQPSEGKMLPHKKVLGKITYGEVSEAIRDCRGLITGVARRLGISVYYVKQIFAKYKSLRQDFEEYREMVLDELEVSFLTKARLGDTTAMIFALKCLGKQRGYIEAVQGSVKKPAVRMKIVPASVKKKKAEKAMPKAAENVIEFKKAAESVDG